MRTGGQLSGPVEPEEAYVGHLAVALVAALWFAELFVAAGDIQDVIHYLKQNTQLAGEKLVRNAARGLQ